MQTNENIYGKWEPVIGLEVHAQLSTASKIFSGAATRYGAEPNTQACAIDLGLPGVLPVLNKEVVAMAVKFGLSINAEIARESIFERKNYFYPDLPKGYQISQFAHPIVFNGYIDIEIGHHNKRIAVKRAHLEEDAGKSLHEDFHGKSGLDLNRAGIPLLEIVSAPELHTPTEAVLYLKSIHTLVRYLDICDGNMQEGSFRCDANVSIRRQGDTKLGTRTEIKNINSFRFVEKAIHYEIERQINLVENGGTVFQETRLYDANKNETRTMRSKEEAYDYRYFPDPDLLPVVLTESFIEEIKNNLPELPAEKHLRFIESYGLSEEDASALTTSYELANYFEKVINYSHVAPKLAANWIMGELTAALHRETLGITNSKVNAEQLGKLLKRIQDNTISGKIAKTLFESMWNTSADIDTIIEKQDLKQVSDQDAIEKIVDDILAKNPEQVAEYRAGKNKVFGYFVGQVMKLSEGKANPNLVNELLKKKLGSVDNSLG